MESGIEERHALFAKADPEVRRAVEALLRHASSNEGPLDRPAWDPADEPSDGPAARIAPGERVGPYRVDAHIGGGGMGEVYRATDERLTRTVAIKISAAQFSHRFEREARVIAALNHPNICQIYDVGPNYLVMEYVDGLPVVLSRQEPIPSLPALRLAIQIASAMAAAHAQGIIHRDLKPANILVTASGVVKLLDFGLAKQKHVTAAAGDRDLTQSLTQAGFIIGTPDYMSPEQAEGRSADTRSDIFCFGTILYEMVAGRRAFAGTSAASVLGAILHREPDPLAAPPALAAIAFKCLAKSPDDRFQSATELLAALERAAAGVVPSRVRSLKNPWLARAAIAGALLIIVAGGLKFYWKRVDTDSVDSVAVIPFDIQSKDAEADYISDGISESINNSLARLSGLKVIPNSVAAGYKGKAREFQKIGGRLGVQAVLSGRVVQRGEHLSINIELDDVLSGKQLWGRRYVRELSDLLLVQNDIAKEVSQRLRTGLSAAEQSKLTLGSTSNPLAYQLYLKGEHYTDKFTKDGFDKGIDFLNQAIAIDPGYSLAYSALAYNYINQDDWFLDPRESAPKARAAVQKALALDETNAEAHVALAIEEQWYEWNWTAAETEFKRAIELDPNEGSAYGYYSWFLPSMLRNDDALDQAHRQLKIYPLSTGSNGNLGSVLVFTHHWDEAIEQLKYAIDLDPNYWFDYCFLGRAYEQKGNFEAAIETFQRGLKLDGNIELWAGLGHAYAASGNRTEALKVIEHLKELSKQAYIAPYNVAVIYAGLGDRESAFEWLNRAYQARSYLMAIYLNTDARLDTLNADLRFDELKRRVGLPFPK